uniref:CSON011233 protein n=1 Tax=Culicoides sonorensis TaxID=179676 RepID=A0A336M333_CULSO
MKLLIVTLFALLAVASARINFDEVRPIEEKLLQDPDRYPLWTAFYSPHARGSGRIVGGSIADPGQFPYQCAQFISAAGGTYFCGCSIIGPRTILTAAHCVDEARSVEVILGAQNIRQNEPSQVVYEVPASSIKVHEKWDTRRILNDIAVINLSTDIKFNDRIQPISLPRWSDVAELYTGEACTTSGWGPSSSISDVLRWVETKVITNTECANVYGTIVTAGNICATGAGGKSSCNGDSGGPQTVVTKNGLTQVGIVSFGASAGCERGYPHAYTRITRFLDWIEANIASARVNFDEVRPIEEKLLQDPERYPLWTAFYGPDGSGRIVGGSIAQPGQFPYQCAQFISAAGGTYFCGCSIIGPRTILTAAHCVDEARSVEVILGAQNIRQNEPSQVVYEIPASSIKVHENWDTRRILNDIAVINLSTDIKFNDRIQPINLPKWSDVGELYTGEVCTTSGWGPSSSISDELRWVETQVITNTECANVYGTVVTAGNICASGTGGKSSCNGDSGGPQTVKTENGLTQVGIVSFGASAGCERGYPHAYTRITRFLDWIVANSEVEIRP